jgi:hypothetical protein
MPKTRSPFAGIKLTEQTPPAAGPDQRLFASPMAQKQPRKPQLQVPQQIGKKAKKETGKETSQPGKSEGSKVFDLNITLYRKDSFLFTTKEFEALEDLKLELRRKFDLKVTKNDLARSGIHYLVEDTSGMENPALLCEG